MARILRFRVFLIILFVVGQIGFCLAAQAYFEGGFPGKGSYEDWQKANLEYYKGVQLQQDGNIEEALDSFDTATKIYRYDSRYWNSLGICRQESKNQLDAEQAFRTATSVNPNGKQSWLCLRNLLKLEGRDAEAKEADVQLRRIDVNSPGVENSTEWHEKQEKDKETPVTLLKQYLGN